MRPERMTGNRGKKGQGVENHTERKKNMKTIIRTSDGETNKYSEASNARKVTTAISVKIYTEQTVTESSYLGRRILQAVKR